jgi:ribonuclease HII
MAIINGKFVPDFSEEKELQKDGLQYVAGLDEVGRGSLAGPVVTGLVVFPAGADYEWLASVRDSKELTIKQREELAPLIKSTALVAETGLSSAEEIDQLGIVPATRLAMQRSLDAALLMPQFLLIDAIKLPSSNIPQKSIVKGDSKCLSIAASSILAKVTRDSLMSGLSEKYPGYGFEKHKGYGTSKHLEEIERLGPCKLHRLTFAPMNKIDHHPF